MGNTLVRAAVLGLSLLCSTAAFARVEVAPVQNKSLGLTLAVRITEDIAPGDYERLLQGLKHNPGKFARKIALLDSIGGSLGEAIKMGRLLREAGFDTWVPRNSVCQGTCVYLPGRRAYAPGARLCRAAPSLFPRRRFLAGRRRQPLQPGHLPARDGRAHRPAGRHGGHRAGAHARAFRAGPRALPAQLSHLARRYAL